jgi:hypothetical protein
MFGDSLAALATGGVLGLATYAILAHRLGVLMQVRALLAGLSGTTAADDDGRGTGDPVSAATSTAP